MDGVYASMLMYIFMNVNLIFINCILCIAIIYRYKLANVCLYSCMSNIAIVFAMQFSSTLHKMGYSYGCRIPLFLLCH